MPITRALDMLRTCVKNCHKRYGVLPVSFIFCGDSVRRKLDRMKIDETYKEDRPPLTNLKFYIFRKVFEQVVNDLGCGVIFHDGAEGDDVIASLVNQMSTKCNCAEPCIVCKCDSKRGVNHIVVFSCDRDCNILLEYKHVVLYRPPSLFYTRDDFVNEYSFHPKEFAVYKALIGDKSDGLKGVPLWGDMRAKNHILKGDVIEVLKKCKTLEVFEKSLALVTLNYNIPDLVVTHEPIVVKGSEELVYTLKREYYNKDCLEDVIFAEKRLEEACNG